MAAATLTAGTFGVASAALPPALATAYAHDQKDFCDVAQVRKSGDERVVVSKDGTQVHFVRAARGCGASNCAVGAYVPDGEAYRKVAMELAQTYQATPDGALTFAGEGDASLSERDRYRWDGRTYAISERTFIYEGKIEKPISTIAFAAGASSATLHGDRVTRGFPDEYAFDASAGQHVSIRFVRRDSKLAFVSVIGTSQELASSGEVKLVWQGSTYAATLPSTGTYTLELTGAGDADASYELVFAIH